MRGIFVLSQQCQMKSGTPLQTLPGEALFFSELVLTRWRRVQGREKIFVLYLEFLFHPLKSFVEDIKQLRMSIGNHHLFMAGKKFQKCLVCFAPFSPRKGYISFFSAYNLF